MLIIISLVYYPVSKTFCILSNSSFEIILSTLSRKKLKNLKVYIRLKDLIINDRINKI